MPGPAEAATLKARTWLREGSLRVGSFPRAQWTIPVTGANLRLFLCVRPGTGIAATSRIMISNRPYTRDANPSSLHAALGPANGPVAIACEVDAMTDHAFGLKVRGRIGEASARTGSLGIGSRRFAREAHR